MSVIGIDFGNESCYVAVARAGGIETIANDYSLRSTPSCVAFSSKNRILGVAAKNQMVTNMNNTVHGFKRLLGRNFTDPYVEKELKHLPYQCVQTKTGGIGIKVNFLNEAQIFSPEQVTSMLFTKLKDVAETALKAKVNDCVISVPSYFTNKERKALLDAASIAGLNVLRLFNETTATALAYGIYKQDLPEDKPRNVVFVDAGHASLQVSACAFHKGKLKMLASAADVSLGGRDIDDILAGHFADEFVTRYRIDARKNARAWLRLTAEVEKIKKQMSANSTKLPLNIECFMDDKDVRSDIKRSDMETLCADLFKRAGETMRKCLDDSKLKLEEIYAVEIVGGSSRIPAIKQLIEQIFHVTASTTLNQDEAVSRGCALQCAMLSPAIRVREFNVTDIQNFPVKLVWEQNGEMGEMEVFEKNHPVPFSKMLTFYRKEQFSMQAFYVGPTPYPDPYIGDFTIKEVKPTPSGECQKVKVKVRVNLNGIVSVTSASLLDKLSPSEQAESADDITDPAEPEHDNSVPPTMGSNEPEEQEVVAASDKKEKKKKATVKTVELPIEAHVGGLSVAEVNAYHEQEGKMISGDRQEKERVDARNALEEYVYDIRGKLTSDDELASFVAEVDRSRLCQDLDRTETWLYEEGEDCTRNIYAERLSKLKAECEPIKVRRTECELRPLALQELAAAIQLSGKAVEQFRAGDARYVHLAAADVDKVAADVDAALKWLEGARQELSAVPQCEDAPITCARLRQERQTLENHVSPILNKPKPEAEVVPPVPKKEEVDGQGDHIARENTEHEDMDVE